MVKKTAQIDVKVTGSRSLQDIENELNGINQQLQTMDVNSDAFKEMSVQAQALDGELQGVNQQLSYISPAEQADGFLKMGEGILGSVAAVQGLSAAFGGNTEKMEETIKKLVGLVAAMDGLRKVSEALQRENLVKLQRGFQNVGKVATTSFGKVRDSIGGVTKSMGLWQGATTKGVKIMNTALTGFVITAILVALTLAIQAVIKNWDELVGIFSKSKAEVNAVNDEFAELEKTLGRVSELMEINTTSLEKWGKAVSEILSLDPKDLFRSDKIAEANKEVVNLEQELAGMRKGTLGYLKKEAELAQAKLDAQAQFNSYAAQEYGTLKQTVLLNTTETDLKIKILKLQISQGQAQEKLTANQSRYYEEVQKLQKLEEDGAKKRKIKDQEEIVNTLAEGIKLQQEYQESLNGEISAAIILFNDLFGATNPLDELSIKYIELERAVKDANIAIQEFLDKNKKPINLKAPTFPDTANDVIQPIAISIDEARTKWDVFKDAVEVGLYDIQNWTEDWGTQIGDFANEYLAPIANEIINIASANADLFAAEQERVIALAELKIDQEQKVVDESIALQDELNASILDKENLLKDANAERYDEIKKQIADEKMQRDAAAAAEEESIKKIGDLNYQIAHASWEIEKKDAETSKVSAGIQGALAIIQALASPFPLNIALPVLIGAATAKQIAAINTQLGTYTATEPQRSQFAEGGMLEGASHASGGIPIEAEGGEYVVNKKATAMFLPFIEAINNVGRPKFADGGIVPNMSTNADTQIIDYDLLATKIKEGIQPVVSVIDITDRQNKVKVIQGNASI